MLACEGVRSCVRNETTISGRTTPAHRSQAVLDSPPGPERRTGMVNINADLLAKQALRIHPQPSEA
eukprot:3355795-Pyramimonas_sp.AAC.1